MDQRLKVASFGRRLVWPTIDDPALYQFNSLWLELKQTRTTYERNTYNMLDLVGDLGGLYDGLSIIARIIVGPVAYFALNARMLSAIFSQKSPDDRYYAEIPEQNFFATMCCQGTRYPRMLSKMKR